MKYFTIMLLIATVASVSATSDPFQHSDSLHSETKQIVKLNKNNKPHSKFFGREKVVMKRGIAFHKKSALNHYQLKLVGCNYRLEVSDYSKEILERLFDWKESV